MIKRRSEMKSESRKNVRGGKGELNFLHILEQGELANKANMFAEITLMQGESIGLHEHTSDGEIYIIKSGCATVTDNGCEETLLCGDAMWTTGGGTHSIENRSVEPLCIYAIVLP